MPTRVLLTGSPGVGKTTAIRKILSLVAPNRCVGFFAEERLIGGRRSGFNIRTLSGREGLLSSPELGGEPRFGTVMPDGRRRLGVSLSFLEDVACPEMLAGVSAGKGVLLDEIGPMQAISAAFRSSVELVLASDVFLIASVAQADDPWLSALRSAQREHIVVLTRSSRDIVVEQVCQSLRQAGILAPDARAEGAP